MSHHLFYADCWYFNVEYVIELYTFYQNSIDVKNYRVTPKFHYFILFSAQSESSTIQESSEDASSYEYNYDYDGEEQDASEDVQREGEEVERASFNPQFTTEAQHFKVPAQHTIRLPCRVDRLGIKHF